MIRTTILAAAVAAATLTAAGTAAATPDVICRFASNLTGRGPVVIAQVEGHTPTVQTWCKRSNLTLAHVRLLKLASSKWRGSSTSCSIQHRDPNNYQYLDSRISIFGSATTIPTVVCPALQAHFTDWEYTAPDTANR